MFYAFQPIIEKRMLKLISFGRDYCVKGVGTSELKLANQSSKATNGSNGGTEYAKVLPAGTEVVMEQVAIPPCAAINSLGSIGTSVAPGSNGGAEPVKCVSVGIEAGMENVSVDTFRSQQLMGMENALPVATAIKRPRDEAFKNVAGKRMKFPELDKPVDESEKDNIYSYFDDDQIWSDPKIYEEIDNMAYESQQKRLLARASNNPFFQPQYLLCRRTLW